MPLLYPGTTVSGYNANPPPDDGTQVANNLVTWATIKSKLSDPVNTFAGSADSNITSAFGKTTDGAAVLTITTDYTVGTSDQGKLIKVTVSGKTITTPDVSVVGAPFMYHVLNLSTGTITLAGNSTNAQTIDGQTSQVIQPGSGCAIKTDGTNWFTFGLKAPQITTSGAVYGFNQPINLGLVASVGSNILTVAVKTVAGNDPSAGDPVLIPFRDSNPTLGGPVWITVNSALSINTNATGATLGSSNSTPFRFWIVAFNNSGTVVLALINCSTATQIFPIDQNLVNSATGISGAATSAGTFYSPNGTTITSKSFHILGWLEYSGGLATAGTYSAVPTLLQLFGPGCKLPGDIVQSVFKQDNTAVGGPVDTALSQNISPTSAANLIRYDTSSVATSSVNSVGNVQMKRGSTLIGTAMAFGISSAGATVTVGNSMSGLDQPGTTSSTNYVLHITTGGTYDEGTMMLSEIMG